MQKQTNEKSAKFSIADLPETNDLTQKNEKTFEFDPVGDESPIRDELKDMGVRIINPDIIDARGLIENQLFLSKFKFNWEKIERMLITKVFEDQYELLIETKEKEPIHLGLGKREKSILRDIPPELLIEKS